MTRANRPFTTAGPEQEEEGRTDVPVHADTAACYLLSSTSCRGSFTPGFHCAQLPKCPSLCGVHCPLLAMDTGNACKHTHTHTCHFLDRNVSWDWLIITMPLAKGGASGGKPCTGWITSKRDRLMLESRDEVPTESSVKKVHSARHGSDCNTTCALIVLQ